MVGVPEVEPAIASTVLWSALEVSFFRVVATRAAPQFNSNYPHPPRISYGCQLPTSTHYPQVHTSTGTYLLHQLHNYILLMNSSACTLILLDVQLYKYLDFLHVRQKNDIPSAFLFYLRISAAHKLPTRMSYQLLQPASTHVGSIYPRLVGMRVQKGHL